MIGKLNFTKPQQTDDVIIGDALSPPIQFMNSGAYHYQNHQYLLDATVHGTFEDLSEPLNLTLYRLIQEGLTNVYKHANAKQVTITLERIRSIERDQDELSLAVADDGCGMESNTRTSRFGLSGMRERVEMAGGTFKLESAPGRGLRLEAHLPANGEN